MEDIKQIQEFFSKPLEENIDKKYSDFLVALRDSGATNMFGAAPYLQAEFGLDKREAREVLANWMRSFSESLNENEKFDKIAKMEYGKPFADLSIAQKQEMLSYMNKEWEKALETDYERRRKGDYSDDREDGMTDYQRRRMGEEMDLDRSFEDVFGKEEAERRMRKQVGGINDPILMKMRAAKDAIKNKKPDFSKESDKNVKKLAFLKKERAQLMRDMEEEAEPEGGPIADEYGSKLNRIDAAIAKLSGRKEMTYDQAIAEAKVDEDLLKKGGKLSNALDALEVAAKDAKISGDKLKELFAKFKQEMAVNEDNSYARVSMPRFVKDKNNPNFLNVYIDYDIGPGGASMALGKETMTGQIRRLSAAKAMRLAGDVARDLEAEYNLEDIEITDLENGKVRIFAVSDDFIDMNPNMLGENKMLKQAKLSSAEYQKAKKLKDFNKDDYEWNPVEGLYVKEKKSKFKKHGEMSGFDMRGLNESVAQTLAETIKLGEGVIEEELCPKGKAYIKRRKAAGEKSSAYLSGRAVKVCKGQMSGRKKKK